MLIAKLVSRLRGETGSVMITVALILPTLILFGIFTVDTANWWVHKRHLQVQADAAALAGALQVGVPCYDAPVQADATKYSGAIYNPQLGGTPPSRVHVVLNGKNFFGQSGPNESDMSGSQCADKSVDVKMTETDVPWFFKAAGLTPFINTRARVSIKALKGTADTLPIGVPEPNPNRVWVQLIDEDTHTPLDLSSQGFTSDGKVELKSNGSSGGLAHWNSGFALTGKNLDLSIDRKHIGVRTILSGSDSSNCADPLVECYDNNPANTGDQDPNNNGVMLIHGTTTPASDPVATGGVAKAYSVFLTTGAPTSPCPHAYFNVNTATCNVFISAQVRFNSDVQPGDFSGGNPKAKVQAVVPGVKNPIDLTPPSTGSDVWTGSIPVDPATNGPLDITLQWVQKTNSTINGQDCSKAQGCTGSFGGDVMQRTFHGTSDRSGPIQFMDVQDIVGGTTNTFFTNAPRCGGAITSCTHRVAFSLDLLGALVLNPNDPTPIALRVLGGGSHTQALDCDPNVPNIKQELETPSGPTDLNHGCHAHYTINTGTACPNSINALGAQPWSCVGIQTGDQTGQVPRGLNQRTMGDETPATCTAPNHWPTYNKLTDPRVLPVFIVPYGAFSGNGSGTVPVMGFASFYITGWSGKGGYNNPCQNNGDQFAPGTAGDEGTISGHFVIRIVPDSDPSETACDFTQVGDCTAVLTK